MSDRQETGPLRGALRQSLGIGGFAWVYFSALMIMFRTTAPLSLEAVEAVLLVMLDYVSVMMGGGVALASFIILMASWRFEDVGR